MDRGLGVAAVASPALALEGLALNRPELLPVVEPVCVVSFAIARKKQKIKRKTCYFLLSGEKQQQVKRR